MRRCWASGKLSDDRRLRPIFGQMPRRRSVIPVWAGFCYMGSRALTSIMAGTWVRPSRSLASEEALACEGALASEGSLGSEGPQGAGKQLAVEQVLAALQACGAMVRSKDRIRCMKLQHQAEGYLELGMPVQALGCLERLGDVGGSDTQTLVLQGEALRALGKFTEALVPLKQAAAAEPENTHLWLAMGGATSGRAGSIWPSTPWSRPSRPIRKRPSFATIWPAIGAWPAANAKPWADPRAGFGPRPRVSPLD